MFKHDIEAIILDAFKTKVGRSTSRREVRTWKESLFAMAKVLNDASIPDTCGVGVEYGIPQSAKRIDLLLSGK